MKIFYWIIRIYLIIFILFISLFALDVFSQPNWLLALLIHLIPSFVLIMLAIFSWRNSFLGGILFSLIAVFSLFFFSFTLIISLPLFVISILFFIENYFLKLKYGENNQKNNQR